MSDDQADITNTTTTITTDDIMAGSVIASRVTGVCSRCYGPWRSGERISMTVSRIHPERSGMRTTWQHVHCPDRSGEAIGAALQALRAAARAPWVDPDPQMQRQAAREALTALQQAAPTLH